MTGLTSCLPSYLPACLPQMQAVTGLIRYLQSMRGCRLWPRESSSMLAVDATPALCPPCSPPSAGALQSLVRAVVDAMGFEQDLQVRAGGGGQAGGRRGAGRGAGRGATNL